MSAKVIVSGQTVEFKDYKKPFLIDNKRKHDCVRTNNNEKRSDNLFRAKEKVKHIIWCNISEYTKFLTLTYKDIVLDYKDFKKDFDSFRKSMSRMGYNLKFLYVLERQKERGIKEGNEGCIHCHMVIFNNEYIPFQDINKAWKFGSTDIHVIEGTRYTGNERAEKIKDLGIYVSKYITKDTMALPGNRTYSCSLGLNRPNEYKISQYRFFANNHLDITDNPHDLELYDNFLYKTNVYHAETIPIEYKNSSGDTVTNSIYYRRGVLKNE